MHESINDLVQRSKSILAKGPTNVTYFQLYFRESQIMQLLNLLKTNVFISLFLVKTYNV